MLANICGGHIFKCRVTFLDRWSHCIKYAVQRHRKADTFFGVCFFIIMIIKTRTFRAPEKRKLFGKRRNNAMSDK